MLTHFANDPSSAGPNAPPKIIDQMKTLTIALLCFLAACKAHADPSPVFDIFDCDIRDSDSAVLFLVRDIKPVVSKGPPRARVIVGTIDPARSSVALFPGLVWVRNRDIDDITIKTPFDVWGSGKHFSSDATLRLPVGDEKFLEKLSNIVGATGEAPRRNKRSVFRLLSGEVVTMGVTNGGGFSARNGDDTQGAPQYFGGDWSCDLDQMQYVVSNVLPRVAALTQLAEKNQLARHSAKNSSQVRDLAIKRETEKKQKEAAAAEADQIRIATRQAELDRLIGSYERIFTKAEMASTFQALAAADVDLQAGLNGAIREKIDSLRRLPGFEQRASEIARLASAVAEKLADEHSYVDAAYEKAVLMTQSARSKSETEAAQIAMNRYTIISATFSRSRMFPGLSRIL